MVRAVSSTVYASLLLVMTAAPARADWLITPYLGSAFGGAASSQHVTYGASAAWMSHGIVGVEFDGSIAPDLLDEDAGVILGITDSNVTTLMGSFVIGAPLGEPGIRPYAVAGAGLIRSRLSDADDIFDIDESSFGINVGGGVHALVGKNVGLRADLRYFRGVRDTDSSDDVDLELGGFDFWRATVGATFRF
ncbi:MAG: outer membrane beta-barrel protein [Vicinamibacteraceae bacterium]